MQTLIKIFLEEGLPKGVRTASIAQWNGHAICGPRTKINEIIALLGEEKCCLYFLVGGQEQSGLFDVYVGEADGFNSRIKNHVYAKDWWETVVVFYGQDLTKTSVQYLESICLKRIRDAGRCIPENKNNPTLPTILREDVVGLEIFFNNVALLMPLFGYDIFVSPIENNKLLQKETMLLYCKGKGAVSTGVMLDDGKLKVFGGSTATKENAPNFETHNYKKLKDELLKMEKLVIKDDFLLFKDDYIFDSPSAAAAVILARSAAGPSEWKDKNGLTLKNILENLNN